MNAFEKIVDEIDCELFRLAEKSHRLWEVTKNKNALELSKSIDAARSKSFSMLPGRRRQEVNG